MTTPVRTGPLSAAHRGRLAAILDATGAFSADEVERRLQGQHARLLVIETSSRSDYTRTRAFYSRRGYADAARVSEFYAPGDDRIILTKRFHSPTGRGA